MDAAQAEKMREREAMENVKLLYHDNMIEMTPVSIARMCLLTRQYLVLLILISFVTPYSSTIHHMNICNCGVELNDHLYKSITIIFSLVGKAVINRWCDFIGYSGMHE